MDQNSNKPNIPQKKKCGFYATSLVVLVLIGAGFAKNGLLRDKIHLDEYLNVSFSERAYDAIQDSYATVVQSTKKIKNSTNVFTTESVFLFNLIAPEFKSIPLERLSTYQIKRLPTSTTEYIEKTRESLKPTQSKPDSLSNALLHFRQGAVLAEDAAVNIFCSQKIGNKRKTMTGSGVLISEDGIVLTNAHVAQFPFVSETNTSVVCMARAGLHAENTFGLKTIFISPEWSYKNAAYINNGGTVQTGENDYALLKLISSNNSTGLKPIKISYDRITTPGQVTLVSYPANILATNINASLTRQKENLPLLSYYSLGLSQQDAFETGASNLAQHGSSGGLVANQNNDLIGIVSIITTINNSTKPGTGNTFQIRGITTNHINTALSSYVKDGLIKVSQGDSKDISDFFNTNYRDSLSKLYSKYLTR